MSLKGELVSMLFWTGNLESKIEFKTVPDKGLRYSKLHPVVRA